jgi:hypothetical protein
MMIIYQATHKYFLLLTIGLSLFFPLAIFGIVEFLAGSFFASFLMLSLGLSALLFVLFTLAKEIVISDNGLICKTQLRAINISFSQIKRIKSLYTLKSLYMEGWNKDKATIFYAIGIKGRPLSFIIFGNTIKNFRELYGNILSKMDSKHNHSPQRMQ